MSNDSYSAFGIFLKKGFLDRELCESIRSEMFSSSGSQAAVVSGSETIYDENVRRTVTKEVSDKTRTILDEKFIGVKGELGAFFGIPLSHPQRLAFLQYVEGDFFHVHVDRGTNPKNPQMIRDRKVSAVLFLNDETKEPENGTYGGGSLVIYGIMKDPRFASHGFTVQGEAGMLLAFPSDLFHEVTPVTSGSRYTVVSWFA